MPLSGPLAILALSAFAQVAPKQPPPVAFVDVRVIPMDRERSLEHATVLVQDGRIAAVGAADSVTLPAGVLRVEGQGRTLIPGLTDTHVHLIDRGELPITLAYGVTCIRNMMGLPAHLDVRRDVERARERGELAGPRVLTSGPFTNAPQIATADAAREAVAAQKRAGYDCVKIHGPLELDVYRALSAACRSQGLMLVGHVPRNLRLEDVLAPDGTREISHAEEFVYTYFDRDDVETDDASIASIAARVHECGVSVAPALVAYRSIVRQVRDLDGELARPEMRLVDPVSRLLWTAPFNRYRRSFSADDAAGLQRSLELQQRLVRGLADAHVVLLLGTDWGNPATVPGAAVHEELALLVESGLSPWAALRSATASARSHLTGRATAGTIAAGEAADLVLLDGDPLADIANAGRVAGVMVGGLWRPGGDLKRDLERVVADYDRDAEFVSRIEISGPEKAIAAFRERRAADAATPAPRAQTLLVLAFAYRATRNPAAALTIAELAAAEHAGDYAVQARLGEALADSGRTADARAAYERALKLEPSCEVARAGLVSLPAK